MFTSPMNRFFLGLALPLLLSACTSATQPATNTPQDSSTVKADSLKKDSVVTVKIDSLIMGVDVAQGHGDIDWAAAKGAGVDFMYAMASKGTKSDSKFAANWEAANKEGIRRGAIHYYQFGSDIKSQLAQFQKNFTMEPGDLLPAIRIDGGSIPPNVRINPVAAQKDILAFVQEAEKAFGCKPLIFTTATSANNYLTDKAFAAFPLWIASLSENEPKLPNTWKTGEWALWMNTENEPMAGFSGKVQRSKFHATSIEFDAELPCKK